jgi:3-oxoadipate enol-lactonase
MLTFTTSDGIKLRYQTDGDKSKKPLLLSNSLGTRLEMWNAQMPAFLEHFYVVRYDKRGHGLSETKPGPTDFARLSTDALELLDHLAIKKAHWCGLSMGGMSGMWLATHVPERFYKFALTCTAPSFGDPNIYNGRMKFALENGMAKMRPLVIDRWFTKDFQAQNPAEINRVGEMIESTDLKGYLACCGALRDMNQSESIRAINAKVLVVSGTHDQATPASAGRYMASVIKGAEYVEVNGAHLSNIEAEKPYTAAVLKFLLG